MAQGGEQSSHVRPLIDDRDEAYNSLLGDGDDRRSVHVRCAEANAYKPWLAALLPTYP